jgi:hypothetical protein
MSYRGASTGDYGWFRIVERHKEIRKVNILENFDPEYYSIRVIFADKIETVFNLPYYRATDIDKTCENIGNPPLFGTDPFGNNFFMEYMEPHNDLISKAMKSHSKNEELTKVLQIYWTDNLFGHYVYIYFKR